MFTFKKSQLNDLNDASQRLRIIRTPRSAGSRINIRAEINEIETKKKITKDQTTVFFWEYKQDRQIFSRKKPQIHKIMFEKTSQLTPQK